MSSPILVIGALGNVGAEVVKELLTTGSKVRAADLREAKVKARFGSSVEAVSFDFTNPQTYQAAFKGVERMFLLRPPHITNIKRDMNPSIDAAKRAGVKHVVFLSLIGIENAKHVPHYKVQTYLKEVNLQTTFLRCSFFMQNLNTTHRKEIKERNEIFVPVGSAKTSFIDVRDVGAAAAVALTGKGHANKNYDLTGHEALDYWQAAKTLSEVLGRQIRYKNPNPIHFFLEIIRRGTPFMFALAMVRLYTATRNGMADMVTSDVKKLLGRNPISFKKYVKDHRESWM